MKIKEKIKDYLLGSEIKKHYSEERRFYINHIENMEETEKKLEQLRKDERKQVILGKYVPNLISLASIVEFCISGSILSPLFLGASEGLRSSYHADFIFDKFEDAVEKNSYMFDKLSTPENAEKIAGLLKK